jgi:hypothetical protein
MMAPPLVQTNPYSARKPKPAPRLLKRKRIVEDYEKLQKNVQDLVSNFYDMKTL